MLREKRDFQCKCKKAQVQKWLEETDKQQQRCRQEKTTAKRVKEVKEQQKDKNIAPGEEEADFVHQPGRDCRGTVGSGKSLEEARIRVRGKKRPPKQEEHQREGNDNEKQPQKVDRAARETTAGARSQDTVGHLEVG